jgi:octaprenyl-diphosphate synthase
MTLPVIHLLAGGDARAEVLIRKIVKERSATMDEWRELRNLLAQHRSIEHARRTASDFVEKAKAALQIFPASAERDALLYLPDYVLSRDR